MKMMIITTYMMRIEMIKKTTMLMMTSICEHCSY